MLTFLLQALNSTMTGLIEINKIVSALFLYFILATTLGVFDHVVDAIVPTENKSPNDTNLTIHPMIINDDKSIGIVTAISANHDFIRGRSLTNKNNKYKLQASEIIFKTTSNNSSISNSREIEQCYSCPAPADYLLVTCALGYEPDYDYELWGNWEMFSKPGTCIKSCCNLQDVANLLCCKEMNFSPQQTPIDVPQEVPQDVPQDVPQAVPEPTLPPIQRLQPTLQPVQPPQPNVAPAGPPKPILLGTGGIVGIAIATLSIISSLVYIVKTCRTCKSSDSIRGDKDRNRDDNWMEEDRA
jgi:hypothetical protein